MAYTGWKEQDAVNWDKVSTEGFTLLDPGVYQLEIIEATPRRTDPKGDTKKKAKSAVRLVLETVLNSDGEETPHKRIYDSGVIVDQEGGFKTKQICEALDISPPETNGFEDVNEFAEALVREKVWAVVGHGKPDVNGNVYNDVKRYISEDMVAEEAERMSGAAAPETKTTPKSKPAAKPAAREAAPARDAKRAPVNGASAKPARRAPVEEITEDLYDDEEEEEAPPPRPRGPGRPRKVAEA